LTLIGQSQGLNFDLSMVLQKTLCELMNVLHLPEAKTDLLKVLGL